MKPRVASLSQGTNQPFGATLPGISSSGTNGTVCILKTVAPIEIGRARLEKRVNASLSDAARRGAYVTAVASAANAAFVAELGADVAIDYRAQDFAARGERWDVI